MNSIASIRRGSVPGSPSIVSSLLSSPVVVPSPAVDGTRPAISRAASIRAQTFSELIRNSGIRHLRSRSRNGGAPTGDPSPLCDLAGDDEALDLAGALIDLADA